VAWETRNIDLAEIERLHRQRPCFVSPLSGIIDMRIIGFIDPVGWKIFPTNPNVIKPLLYIAGSTYLGTRYYALESAQSRQKHSNLETTFLLTERDSPQPKPV
jgi:hypothetical protein